MLAPILQKRAIKEEFGQRIIDEMIRRTKEDNVDKNQKPFKAYSDSYIKSKVFEIYGKSEGDVNLTLTEAMLSSMEVKDNASGVIIQFADQEQNDKAHGHINGIKKRTKSGGITKVRRDFFGVPEKVQGDILKEVVSDYVNDNFDFEAAAKATKKVSGSSPVNTVNEDEATLLENFMEENSDG